MRSTRKKPASDNPFLELTWTDIEDWAGSRVLSRGKSYQRSGAVEELGITKRHQLVAWVDGSTRYATTVSFKRGQLSSTCSCPYAINCKHAVATVIEYLEAIKQKRDVPIISEGDKRIGLAKKGETAGPHESDDGCDDETESDDDGPDDGDCDRHSASHGSLGAFLKGKSSSELTAMLAELAANHPEVRSELGFKSKPASPSSSSIAKTISKEIDKVSAEPGWSNHWDNAGFTPDYSRVSVGLQKLFAAGNYDDVVKLGKKLHTKGVEQANQSNDEGETIEEITAVLQIVYKALGRCSLPTVDKMEQAIDWEMADEFSISDGLEPFWKKKFAKKDWSELADRLHKRLAAREPATPDSGFSRNYERDKLTSRIMRALDSAGRTDEALDLCIREAPLTGSYDRLVSMLRGANKNSEAEEWIRRGVDATRAKLPGLASGLRTQFFEMQHAKRNWACCAAIRAEEFFEQPSISSYTELKTVCEKSDVWNRVRPPVISFLNTGSRPKPDAAGWPLPETGLPPLARDGHSRAPFVTQLIEIAIYEKDIDEALRLYDQHTGRRTGQPSVRFGWDGGIDNQVAEAVKEKYPGRSIAIWKTAAESHANQTGSNAYSAALNYLRRIQKVMNAGGRAGEFNAYVEQIRETNRRKPRLVEMLQTLSGKRIVDA
jgi:uncharacterized Zn finger protein